MKRYIFVYGMYIADYMWLVVTAMFFYCEERANYPTHRHSTFREHYANAKRSYVC